MLFLRRSTLITPIFLLSLFIFISCGGNSIKTANSGNDTLQVSDGENSIKDELSEEELADMDKLSDSDEPEESFDENDTDENIFTDEKTQDSDQDESDPCESFSCPEDKHCESVSETAECVNNSCDELECKESEECIDTDSGGAICVDISCNNDLECPLDRFCDGGKCVDDVCSAGSAECNGRKVDICLSNGSKIETVYKCVDSDYFDSKCIDDGNGDAYCPCEDDWDCPENTICEAGKCTGKGSAPTCKLPPEPFDNVLPESEIEWGGSYDERSAAGSPFAESAQVVISPVVANLNDDNGDGIIDENDFPEIIFTTFHNSYFTSNGVLRAIHGGGKDKGKDFFATCGDITWHESEPVSMECSLTSDADLDSTASLAVGDLDYDGVPEIVAITEDDRINIYSNNGELISKSEAKGGLGGSDPAPSLVNIDNIGFAEIVIGPNVFTLEKDDDDNIIVLDRFKGSKNRGTNHGQGSVVCPADLVGDSKMEFVAGTTLYRMPEAPTGVASRSECIGNETGEEKEYCDGKLIVVWDGQEVNGKNLVPDTYKDGFCAVADVLGTDQNAAPGPQNPLDGKAEVIVITEGWLQILDSETGVQLRKIVLDTAKGGGTPNVDDFDGDGFPEIGSAFQLAYNLYDLQEPTAQCGEWTKPIKDDGSMPPENLPRTASGTACTKDADCAAGEAVCNQDIGSCVCLHNGWKRVTEDGSSKVTGSSVFDFNGDGAAEVIYNDECNFRIYDGLSGEVLFKEPSESRTRIEYPVVADVDNDGNAEIVFATSNESGFCSERLTGEYNNGIEVWGDAKDIWVSARRIWNQHSYHITNVHEDGSIPLYERENWLSHNSRKYNSYRSNPKSVGVAPDLTVNGVQVSSPDVACGELSSLLDISVQLENRGDIRVGPGVEIAFEGVWSNPALTEMLKNTGGNTLKYMLDKSIEPGKTVFITIEYDSANNSPSKVPDSIRVIADFAESERECIEDNNDFSVDVKSSNQMADLKVELLESTDEFCPTTTITTKVINSGSKEAFGFKVFYFRGDPEQGGQLVHEKTIMQTVSPGSSITFDEQIPGMTETPVALFAVVDFENLFLECNDANNSTYLEDVKCHNPG